MSGALGLSKSARFPGMNCGRRALLWSPRLRRKRDRFPGASFGRGAAFRLGRGRASIGPTEKRRGAVKGRAAAKRSDVYPLRRPLFCQTGRASGVALQGAGRALTDCRLPVFGRASENQGLRWGSLAHRPGLGLGRGRASIGATEKRRGAVKGRVAAKRSDVYPLRRPLFCQTGRASGGPCKGRAGP